MATEKPRRFFDGRVRQTHVSSQVDVGQLALKPESHTRIYDHGDYVGGIAALRALGYDDNADVATLLGYASRKLGRYDGAKSWYERALAADPNHAVTWSYYGMWQAEQGNLLKAKGDLEKVRLICGTDCGAYKMLKDAIDGTATTSPLAQ